MINMFQFALRGHLCQTRLCSYNLYGKTTNKIQVKSYLWTNQQFLRVINIEKFSTFQRFSLNQEPIYISVLTYPILHFMGVKGAIKILVTTTKNFVVVSFTCGSLQTDWCQIPTELTLFSPRNNNNNNNNND